MLILQDLSLAMDSSFHELCGSQHHACDSFHNHCTHGRHMMFVVTLQHGVFT